MMPYNRPGKALTNNYTAAPGDLMFRQLAKKFVLAVPEIRRILQERDSAWAKISQLETELQIANSAIAENSTQLAEQCKRAREAEAETQRISASLARFDAGKPVTANDREALAWSKLALPQEFRDRFRAVMLETFYLDNPLIDITNAEVFERDLAAHTEYRYRVFEQWIATWLLPAVPNHASMTALEIGSGTGSSTLAFARQVGKVFSFEIDDKATAAARQRLAFFGLDNVEFHEGQFNADCTLARSGQRVDLVVLCAVLEHMTETERKDALQTAWAMLNPGGLLVVADTPNRFAVYDDHTSLLPYYSALPPSLQEQYAARSPRADFRNSIAGTRQEDMAVTLARWGAGISYHDFELALGPNVHDHIILDGYEPALVAMYPDKIDDALVRIAFEHYEVPAHRAFSRSLLHFVLRKP